MDQILFNCGEADSSLRYLKTNASEKDEIEALLKVDGQLQKLDVSRNNCVKVPLAAVGDVHCRSNPRPTASKLFQATTSRK